MRRGAELKTQSVARSSSEGLDGGARPRRQTLGGVAAHFGCSPLLTSVTFRHKLEEKEATLSLSCVRGDRKSVNLTDFIHGLFIIVIMYILFFVRHV